MSGYGVVSFVVRCICLISVMYSSQLLNFSSFTFKFPLVFNLACFTSNPLEVGTPAFGWGISSHFSQWVFWVFISHGGTQTVIIPKDDSVVTSCLLFSVPLLDGKTIKLLV